MSCDLIIGIDAGASVIKATACTKVARQELAA
jgi:hypothetical protein